MTIIRKVLNYLRKLDNNMVSAIVLTNLILKYLLCVFEQERFIISGYTFLIEIADIWTEPSLWPKFGHLWFFFFVIKSTSLLFLCDYFDTLCNFWRSWYSLLQEHKGLIKVYEKLLKMDKTKAHFPCLKILSLDSLNSLVTT